MANTLPEVVMHGSPRLSLSDQVGTLFGLFGEAVGDEVGMARCVPVGPKASPLMFWAMGLTMLWGRIMFYAIWPCWRTALARPSDGPVGARFAADTFCSEALLFGARALLRVFHRSARSAGLSSIQGFRPMLPETARCLDVKTITTVLGYPGN